MDREPKSSTTRDGQLRTRETAEEAQQASAIQVGAGRARSADTVVARIREACALLREPNSRRKPANMKRGTAAQWGSSKAP
eukprot:scaffold8737_cov124-Isochrysis_galbana.AAC.3